MYYILIPVALLLRVELLKAQRHADSAASDAQIRFAEENKFDNTGPGAKQPEYAYKTYKTLDEALVAFLDDPDTSLPEQEKAKAIHLLTHLNREYGNQYFDRPEAISGRPTNIYGNRENTYDVKNHQDFNSFKPGVRLESPVQGYDSSRQAINSVKMQEEYHHFRQPSHLLPPRGDYRNLHEAYLANTLEGQPNIYRASPQVNNRANLLNHYENLRRASLIKQPLESQTKTITRPDSLKVKYPNIPVSNLPLDEPLDSFKYLPPLSENSPPTVNRNGVYGNNLRTDFMLKSTVVPNFNTARDFKSDTISEVPLLPKYQKFGDVSLAHFTKNGQHILHSKYGPFESNPQYLYSYAIQHQQGKPDEGQSGIEVQGPFSLLQEGSLRAERGSGHQTTMPAHH